MRSAQGDGPPLGRELEIADLLSLHQACGRAQHGLDHRRHALHGGALLRSEPAVFQDFEPFWEFVSGPIHAGTGGPSALDNTFGPRAVYAEGAAARSRATNLAPCFGLQFFGHVAIDGATQAMTVTLKDVEDRALWSIELGPDARVAVSTGAHSRVSGSS